MSREIHQAELREKTQQLLHGALKHVRAVALAAALVPLGTVAVSPAVAQPGYEPPPAVPSPCDFVTSGGFVFTDSNEKVTFSAHGGCKNGNFWGHVNYVDRASDLHLDSTQITGYLDLLPPSNGRDICGLARTNLYGSVLFRVRLIDNGEPGTSDAFGINLSSGYLVTTRLLGAGGPGGGNVELHEPNRSTVAPSPAPDESTMCGGVDGP